MNKRSKWFPIAFAAALAGSAGFGALCCNAQAAVPAGSDRIAVKLDDPSRPVLVKVSLVNGGITVKTYDGQEVIVEARNRNGEPEKPALDGMRRLNILRTGLTVEEENNEVRVSTDSFMRPIDLTITVPV
jgi:hypothetical protein